ncbi:hypothetical protein [Desulfopila sp. IMCC35008]|uniref:hypothetical protein n=1 Tax=Desulfopila sp. IMCC35008 TaxID=2653858 RepID=UPI0013D1BB8E|nr:hypothetical protein [Desulfopila sp. IMCC35008]
MNFQNTISSLIFTACVLIFFVSITSAVEKKKEIVSVAILPQKESDSAIVKLRQVIGGVNHVKIVISPKSEKQMFDYLSNLKRKGVEIDQLIIGGHGDGKKGENPGINLEAFQLFSETIDLKKFEDMVYKYGESAENKKRANEGEYEINKAISTQKDYQEKVDGLKGSRGVMAENGVIQILSCNTIASEKGSKFTKDLGELLFGDKKGNIVASKDFVDVYQYGLLDKFISHLYDPFGIRLAYELATNPEKITNPGGQPNLNEFYAEGEWETISINGGSILHDGTYQSEEGGGVLDGGGGVTTDNLSSDRSESDGSEKTLRCPENSVKLSDDNNNNQCVPCDELYVEFNAALDGNDKGYAQTLLGLAPNCDWAISGNQRIKDAESCPGNTVKLSDNNGQNQCVPCDELYSDFNGAASSGDREYAQTLVDLGASCGWSNQAQNELNTPQSCPEGTVKLSDQNNQAECVPCSTLYGDYTAAMGQGDTSYAESLVSLASVCSWSKSVAQQIQNETQQAVLDQKCEQQAPGSHAVINGDRYTCQCDSGMLALTGPNGSSCQSCEQVRGYINSALQRNDMNTVRGLMAGAQSCGWYDQAVKVAANVAQNQEQQQVQNNEQQNIQDMWEWMNAFNQNLNQQNAWMNEYDEIPPGYYDKKKPQRPNVPPKQPPSKPKPTKKKPTSSGHTQSGGNYCTGHNLVCKQYGGKDYSYHRTAVDKNTDWKCDICGRAFMTPQRKLAPGLRGAQRGDVSCRRQ